MSTPKQPMERNEQREIELDELTEEELRTVTGGSGEFDASVEANEERSRGSV